jgi:hypothetical protein
VFPGENYYVNDYPDEQDEQGSNSFLDEEDIDPYEDDHFEEYDSYCD